MSNLRKINDSIFCHSTVSLQFFEANENRFSFLPPWKNSLIFLIFTLSSLLIFCFINRTIRTVSSVSVLNSFLRLLHLLFPQTSYQPAEHKTEISHHSPSKISIILQRRFLIKLLQPRSRSRCSP